MNEIIKLAPKSIEQNQVKEALETCLKCTSQDEYIAVAIVMLRSDGSNFIKTFNLGKRVHLLGAVTDLQYTIAKNGDS